MLKITPNQRYGRLTVVSEAPPVISGNRPVRRMTCLCDCGKTITTRLYNLSDGDTRSCGCLHTESSRRNGHSRWKHGSQSAPLYYIWGGIKQRCLQPNDKAYKWYGGRGITFHPAWAKDYRVFAKDIERDLGPRPPGLTLDRIDNDGSYVPGNLRWATRGTQARNRRH